MAASNEAFSQFDDLFLTRGDDDDAKVDDLIDFDDVAKEKCCRNDLIWILRQRLIGHLREERRSETTPVGSYSPDGRLTSGRLRSMKHAQ